MEDRNRITRLHTLLVVCLVLFAVLLGRMVYLQLWRGDYYAKQSDGNSCASRVFLLHAELFMIAKVKSW